MLFSTTEQTLQDSDTAESCTTVSGPHGMATSLPQTMDQNSAKEKQKSKSDLKNKGVLDNSDTADVTNIKHNLL